MRAVDTLSALASRLPDGSVTTDPKILHERATDCWSLAMLRRVRGEEPPAPAAVVFPASTEDVAAVLAWAGETRTAVIPRGAGSGVCGGAQAEAGAVVLDLSRMDRITGVDAVSQVVRAEAGVRGDRLEEFLSGHELTVGHYPQSIAISTVGGWIAASSAGQASTGFGAIEDMLLGFTAVLPGGEILTRRAVPRSAVGPDLRRLLIGSEGTLAVVTEATLACRARPAGLDWLAFTFPDVPALIDGLRELTRAETGAVVIRGYDETDAMLSFGPLGHPGGCVAILAFPADLWGQAERRRLAAQTVQRAGATGLDSAYGAHWWAHRNDAVGLLHQIMGPERAFGPGVVVDTMEIAGLWSVVPELYTSVRAALAAHAEAVGCHVSHLYQSGASLYFTFLVRGADDRDAEARYLAAWEQAVRSCGLIGGTFTHHHGVGRHKARFVGGEIGESGLGVLRRIKDALDPDQILNPRALLP
jgi:alkyldihydroxyacetonephosphate synthase